MKKIIIVSVILCLCGCADKSSPERHSLYFARHDPTMVGGNYRADPMATAELNLHTYQEIYKQGQDAKSKGVTSAQAHDLAEQVYMSGVNATGGEQTYMHLKEHKTQITPDERASQLWGQTLKETFLDGYNGVK